VKPKYADLACFRSDINIFSLLSLQDGLRGSRPELHEHFVGGHFLAVEELGFVLGL
jgi:hypothetical protein